jgi:hypothetical protein
MIRGNRAGLWFLLLLLLLTSNAMGKVSAEPVPQPLSSLLDCSFDNPGPERLFSDEPSHGYLERTTPGFLDLPSVRRMSERLSSSWALDLLLPGLGSLYLHGKDNLDFFFCSLLHLVAEGAIVSICAGVGGREGLAGFALLGGINRLICLVEWLIWSVVLNNRLKQARIHGLEYAVYFRQESGSREFGGSLLIRF